MSMFNECLIHLCDCTCLNVLHILNYMLIVHKKIFECFNCFWKVFCFEKFQKLCNFVLATQSLESSQSQDPSRELTQKLLRLSSESSPQSQKRLRKISKFWIFRIFATLFGDWVISGSSNHEVYLE